MNLKVDFKKEDCCGCTGCYSICPKDAITMKTDEKGFLYPSIDEAKCIDCGLCIKVCDFKKFVATEQTPDCYAVKHKDEEEIKTSRSGAVFMALCDYVLKKQGVVLGCVQTDKNTIIHKVASTKQQVNSFKGSKYVQSELLDTFKECESYLKQGVIVLFSGTGCHVHGLISFLECAKVDTSNLITCDIVCHGVPSPQLWRDYVAEFERRNNDGITKVDFRDKEKCGWRAHFESFLMVSGNTHVIKNWTNAFYSHCMFRESCYNCKYTTPNRKTDFTIADYWGIEKNVPEFDDNKGVSLVLVRGEKANKIFAEIQDSLRVVQTKLDNSLQPQLIHPIEKGNNYNKFWKDYLKNKNKAIKKYFFPSKPRQSISKFFNKLRSFLGKIKRKIKKLF